MSEKPYLPSNGTEGMIFESQWCDRCIRNPLNPEAKNQCLYLMRALAGEDNGKWFFNGSGAGECIAFRSREEANKNRKQKIDKNQMLLFD